MAYAILRTAKLSSMGQVATSAQHTFREREVLNADECLTIKNAVEGAASSQALREAIKARLELVTARSATKPVICIEYMITASPEAFSRHNGSIPDNTLYFEAAKNWLKARHGVANVVSCAVHTDERSPHLVAYVVPLVERQAKTRQRSVIVGKDDQGKPVRETKAFSEPGHISLCAKEFLGGRDKLRDMQTDFAEKVGNAFGLERGKERSTAKHQTIRAFYAAIDKPVQDVTITQEALKPRLLKKGLLVSDWESEQGVAERVTQAVKKAYEPAVNLAKVVESDRQRMKSLEVTARQAENRARAMEKQLQQIKDNAKTLMMAVVNGGETLELLQQQFRENLQKSKELDKPQDRGKGITR